MLPPLASEPAAHSPLTSVSCRRKTVRKEYLALAVGVPSPPTFTVDAPIDRDEDDV